ncbi:MULTISPECIES: hypothetical protein [Acidithrix]|uniref:Uncharacterized protein n=1 Tax=Acidithrix ferrooxidans TaxID=1280514 RepID=A0A0D8HMS2_9ACTN|nr:MULTISPECIES: hypothetical protein [Acidithrix]KJF18371.1 hypothetical protein AXFE_07590 [Acidithrix ferrooxidans]
MTVDRSNRNPIPNDSSDHTNNQSEIESTAISNNGIEEEDGRIMVGTWVDPLVESLGFDPRTNYVEYFWLPILGPSCIFLLRRMAYAFDLSGDFREMSLHTISYEIGLGSPKGFSSSITRTVNRCIQFDMAKLLPNGQLAFRRSLPPLSQRQLNRLPIRLQEVHEALILGYGTPVTQEAKDQSVAIAVSLLESHESEERAIEDLARWKIEPTVAKRALEALFPRDDLENNKQ